MKILVVNAGSTSFKCRLYSMPEELELMRFGVERIGRADAELSYSRRGQTLFTKQPRSVPAHADAARIMTELVCSPDKGVVGGLEEIDAIGFKTVQAGEKNGTVPLTADVLEAMERYAPLAPAHNPAYLACIRFFSSRLPAMPLIGVFEPGFHTEIPEYARIFGAPFDWYADHGVAKYGYHGATFRYVTARLAKQSGLIQSGRTGDIDPFVLPYIMERKGIGLTAALKELSSGGGMLGISGVSADMRDIQEAAAGGNRRAQLSIDKFIYDAVRYIGSFHALLGGVDVIAFSGGIGFNNGEIRKKIIERIAFLGVDLSDNAHGAAAEQILTNKGSKIAVVAIDTNEEIVVARETAEILKKNGSQKT